MGSAQVNRYESVLQAKFGIAREFHENGVIYYGLLKTKEGCADLARWMNNELNNCIEQEQKEQQ